MMLTRRQCIAALSTLAVSAGCKNSPGSQLLSPLGSGTPASDSTPTKKSGGDMAPLKTFTPEMFGAAGDGITNDTEAFIRLSAAVNGAGGGTINFRPTTYIVGGQDSDPTGQWAFAPTAVMNFNGCSKNLIIQGNGACLRCANGLRYGTFDPSTGQATHNPLPYTGSGQIASPYRAMITVQNCTGQVYIKGLELDGNLAGLVIGGPYGDTGWQLPAIGLQLLGNTGGELVVGVHSHHHAQDGIYLDGVLGRTTSTNFSEVISEYNGRQGCSIVGGCNYSFANCNFNHSGRGGLMSAPGAGVDIESEVNPVRNLSFSNCEFSNNSGAGMVADSGDTDGASFDSCKFVGTTTWSAWPRKPHFKFTSCQFVGAICNVFGNSDATQATQFSRCTFVDDPSLSPTGQVYGPSQAIANLGSGDQNVLFDGCNFKLSQGLLLPWTAASTFNNCTMSQTSSQQAYPKGTYTGNCTINGNVDLYSSKVVGQLVVNGNAVPPTNFVGW